VSSSGLIYAVIVGAWAAYLVPMWLRRQDELNEARPTERFSTAIRLLSGRAAMERKAAKARGEAEPEPAEPSVATQPDPEPASGTSAEPVDVRALAVPATEVTSVPVKVKVKPQLKRATPAKTGRAKVLARRRRTTTMLFLAFTAGMIVAAVGGLAFLWAPAVPAVLLTFYIAHLRHHERRRFEIKLDRRRAAQVDECLREHPAYGRKPSPEPKAKAPSPSSPDQSVQRPPEPPATVGRRALVEQTDHAEWVDQQREQRSAPAEESWAPAPVPRPTFVTAPVTRRRPTDRSGTPLFDQQSNHPDLDRPRAANE
jgi:hypothetical protein